MHLKHVFQLQRYGSEPGPDLCQTFTAGHRRLEILAPQTERIFTLDAALKFAIVNFHESRFNNECHMPFGHQHFRRGDCALQGT